MLIEMAARRKSLKPTNKIHHQLQIDDDVDDDMNESTAQVVQVPNTAPDGSPYKIKASQHSTKMPVARSAVFSPASLSGQFQTLPQTTAPHISLPTDIYQDFEALKSATNMDSTELMRKLLTDFHKITSSSQSPEEHTLDEERSHFLVSRPGNVLDLSKRKQSDEVNCSHDSGSSPVTILGQGYTDDQLAMLEKEGGGDESIDLKPLDLTLQKSQPASADMSRNKRSPPVCPSMVKPTSTPKEDSHCSQSFKHAGSYVINLESRNESPQLVNSSLAQVLRMDIPLNSLSNASKHTNMSQENFFLAEGTASSNIRKSISESSVQLCQGGFRSKLFQNDTDTSALFKMGSTETTCRDSILSCLPSYAEAVTSVINSHHSKRPHDGVSQDASAGAQSLDKPEPESLPGGVSFLQINTDDSDMKMFPLTLNSQLLTPANTFEAHPKQQHNLLHQLLQHQLKSENKSLQQKLQSAPTSQVQNQQKPITTFCGGPVSHVQMMQVPGLKPDLNDVSGLAQAIKTNDISYPNFLLESHAVGHPSITTAMPTVSVASSSLANTAMPMSTFFMTTSANGGVGHMVAIPVIHAVSDGVTGLQSFAFAPHHMSLSNNDCSKSMQISDELILASQTAQPDYAASCSKKSDVHQNQDLPSADSFTSDTSLSASLGAAKSKPGRPRGRGGRGQSQRNQNKDMKLLTENMLFPGVYTSILKLPWSRRSRNKTKTKTISELKKQAQIIAHSRVNEDDLKYNDGNIKQECSELVNSSTNIAEQICVQNKIETLVESPQLEHELVDHNQKHQMEHQKFKDLEQQQRLHLQYHIKLQEEQHKLAKQIEQSYFNINSDSPDKIPFPTPSEQFVSEKEEMRSNDTFERDYADPPVGSIVATESTLFHTSMLPQEPAMIAYSSADISTPKKTPRKRGRPPKIPYHQSKTNEAHPTFNPSTHPIFSTSAHPTFNTSTTVKYEPDNFLHSNLSSANFLKLSSDPQPNNNLSMFPQHRFDSETEKFETATAPNVAHDREITLENKINFLTNKIGMELSQSVAAQSQIMPTLCIDQTVKCETETGNHDDNIYQEMNTTINKSHVDVKTRRKKVSRLLKSDENFMYATFKIKPKGLTPRKSRKRRKDVQGSTSVVAETIANLRQKALRDCVTPRSEIDASKLPSMVAWKFHEQYPCSNEEDDSKDRTAVCVKCGNCFLSENDEVGSHECGGCLAEQTVFTAEHVHNETTPTKVGTMDIVDAEMKTECCITCGDIFQKHFSDPGARCDVCQNNTPRVIKSSKLFSFQDTSTDSMSMASKPPAATAPSFMAAAELLTKDSKLPDNNLAKINSSHLFCSLCRMEFIKICDYLTHIRETHDTKLEETAQFLSSGSDKGRKSKISKTKKSLAHKTLTCPVEECPHFFREQKDLDIHFMKKHSNLSISFQGNSFMQPDEHDIPTQVDQSLLTSEASIEETNGIYNTEQDMLVSHRKTETAASSCEKPLQCEFCAYRCRQKNALTWHMRKHPEAASQYRKYSNLNVD